MSAGYFNASGVKSGERLAQYVRLAEAGLWTTLLQRLDEGTTSEAAHPNAIIIAAVTVLTALQKGRGQSALPAVEAYCAHLRGESTDAMMRDIGLHLPKVIG